MWPSSTCSICCLQMFEAFSAVLQKKKELKTQPCKWHLPEKLWKQSHLNSILLFFYLNEILRWKGNYNFYFILIILIYIYTRTYHFLFLIQWLLCIAEIWLACMFMKVKITHKQDAANNSNSTYPKWHFNHRLACKGDIRNIACLSWVPEQDVHHREAFIWRLHFSLQELIVSTISS